MAPTRFPVAIGVVGAGLIGNALLKQIADQMLALEPILNASIKVIGVTNSKKMLITTEHFAGMQAGLASKGEDLNLQDFGSRLISSLPEVPGKAPCAVIVDCTASDAVPDMYYQWMQAGLHIVTPNKKFGAGNLERYKALHRLCLNTGRQFLGEASVGAGLPVLSTLRSVIETGDKVHRIEGILSGTLSYIFNTYKPGMPFSSVVADAKSKGYTEPDPREDLSGMDVARKVVILARQCGLDVTLESLKVDSLVPEPLTQPGVTAEQYMEQLSKFDGQMAQQADSADAAGEVIRYVGCVDVQAGTASVTLQRYPKSHPFAQLSGTDNMLVFTTQRYCQQPLIVRGPGAGAEVTAAGVFSDIIQAIRCHGNAC